MFTDAPWPLIEIAIEPKSRADQEKLSDALAEMTAGDSSFTVAAYPESDQTIIAAKDEHELDVKIDTLKRAYRVDINVGAPQVAYRETLGCRAEIDTTFKAVHGPKGSFARVKLVFEPGEPGSGYEFESRIVGSAVPDEYIPGVIKGLESARANGLLVGFPVIDFKATLVDGAYHDVDSSVSAFEAAAQAAFQELREKGKPTLLEPVMKVVAFGPRERLADLLGYVRGRGVRVEMAEGDDGVATAYAPLASLLGFWRIALRLGQGHVWAALSFQGYEPVEGADGPDDVFPQAAAMRA
jgi:elongation factor G